MISPTSQINALAERVAVIPDPRNYYSGFGGAPEGRLPGQVICFSRGSFSMLGGSAHRANHHRYVLIVSVKGEGTVCIDAANFRLRAGSALLVLPHQYHSYTEVSESICWLFITFEAEQGRWYDLGNSTLLPGGMEVRLIEELLECWESPRRHPLLAWHLGLLLERLSFLPSRQRREPEVEADLLVRVNQYALAHLHRIVSLGELAEHLGRSESHLRAEFRRLTRKPLGGHLRLLRLQHASALLCTTSGRINEIAEACGFDSVYSFSRAFRSHHGHSPSAYRRMFQI